MKRLVACFALLSLPDTQIVKDPNGDVWMEVQINKTIPIEKVADPPRGADFPQIPPGALLGTIRYLQPGGDFCGKPIPPGSYTMRYGLLPEDGAHQGVAPRRDFVLLSPAAADRDAAARPSYEALVEMSRKASGSSHPAILFLTATKEQRPRLQVVWFKNAAVEFGIIVVGKAEE
jgi:hypothetical protein